MKIIYQFRSYLNPFIYPFIYLFEFFHYCHFFGYIWFFLAFQYNVIVKINDTNRIDHRLTWLVIFIHCYLTQIPTIFQFKFFQIFQNSLSFLEFLSLLLFYFLHILLKLRNFLNKLVFAIESIQIFSGYYNIVESDLNVFIINVDIIIMILETG